MFKNAFHELNQGVGVVGPEPNESPAAVVEVSSQLSELSHVHSAMFVEACCNAD